MKKLLLIISIIFFIPVLNAEENTYFDLPQENVTELPVASNSTVNKVYILNNSTYWITNQVSGLRTIQVGDNICDKTYTLSIPANYGANVTWQSAGSYTYPLLVSDNGKTNGSSGITMYYNVNGALQVQWGNSRYIYNYIYGNASINQTSWTPQSSWFNNNCVVKSLDNTSGILDYIKVDAGTSYSWIQVNASQVYPVIPSKIYVPSNNLYCYHFISDNVLRGYVDNPVVNNNVNYYDFDLNHHYRQSTGTETITENPVCLANTTTNYLYREDIVEILIFSFLVGFIVIFIPFKILMSFFKRRF